MKNPKTTLGKIAHHFKARATKIIYDSSKDNFKWQRSFYDYIIRNNRSLNKIREYIINNASTWDKDEHNLNNKNHIKPIAAKCRRSKNRFDFIENFLIIF